jgi:hypothetical protein
MAEIEIIKRLLADGLVMIGNVDSPTLEKHREAIYLESAQAKLKSAGILVHNWTPALNDMIQFVHEYVPEKYHGLINHAWSGIGDWQA